MDNLILLAAAAIKDYDLASGRELLKSAIATDIENPEIYNLLGIAYEKEGNRRKACKFYRVAYYMDQTFLAAKNNLERVCEFYVKQNKEVQWGLDSKEAKK